MAWRRSAKAGLCAIDIEHWPNAVRPRLRTAIRSGFLGLGDVYSSGLPCQYIVDRVPNGDYTLQSTTNAKHVVGGLFRGQHRVDRTRITGNNVSEIVPPWIRKIESASIAQSVCRPVRWALEVVGSHWLIDTGSSKAEADRILAIIKHYKLGSMCFVGRPTCGDVTPMMYWLTDAGSAPSGKLAGEDCVPSTRPISR
jgi:hypothetical protein